MSAPVRNSENGREGQPRTWSAREETGVAGLFASTLDVA